MSSEEPLVSILMAVYNMEATLRDAIASISRQSYKNLEILVLDDASTDYSAMILREAHLEDHRIVIHRNETNLGYPASLNRLAKFASAEYFAIADADDISLPDRIEKQVKFLLGNPEVSVVGTAVEFIGSNGESLGVRSRPLTHSELSSRMYKETPFFHPSVMMRRSFLDTLHGYDERLKRAQDGDLWLRGYRHFKYANLPNVLVRYRASKGLSFGSIFYSAFVLILSGYRDSSWLKGLWYCVRFVLSGILIKLKLKDRLPK